MPCARDLDDIPAVPLLTGAIDEGDMLLGHVDGRAGPFLRLVISFRSTRRVPAGIITFGRATGRWGVVEMAPVKFGPDGALNKNAGDGDGEVWSVSYTHLTLPTILLV